jgi:hypothetical protein
MIQKDYKKNRLSNEWRVAAEATFWVVLIALVYHWNTWTQVWILKKGFNLLVFLSASYVVFRILYYCVCEYTFVTETEDEETGEKYRNGQIVGKEWWEGISLLPYRFVGMILFLVSTTALLVTRNGVATMLLTMVATALLGVWYIAKVIKEIASVEKPKHMKSQVAKAWRKAVREARQEQYRAILYWLSYFLVILIAETFLLVVLTADNPPFNENMNATLFRNLWPGLAMVGLATLIFWITGRGFFIAIPVVLVPFWYSLEYLIGTQILPMGHMNSGIDRIMLPLFLVATMLLESYGPIRRKFFRTTSDWAPIMEQLARDINFS